MRDGQADPVRRSREPLVLRLCLHVLGAVARGSRSAACGLARNGKRKCAIAGPVSKRGASWTGEPR